MSLKRLETGGSYHLGADTLRGDCPVCGTLGTAFTLAAGPIQGDEEHGSVVLRCASCARSIFATGIYIAAAKAFRPYEIYPISRRPLTLPHTPPSAVAALGEAEACAGFGAFTAGALACRRALQLITRERGIDEELFKAIDRLQLPETLKRAAHAVRMIGNEGAHPHPVEWDIITADDLRHMIDVSVKIAREVYEDPAEIEALYERATEINEH